MLKQHFKLSSPEETEELILHVILAKIQLEDVYQETCMLRCYNHLVTPLENEIILLARPKIRRQLESSLLRWLLQLKPCDLLLRKVLINRLGSPYLFLDSSKPSAPQCLHICFTFFSKSRELRQPSRLAGAFYIPSCEYRLSLSPLAD